MAANTREEEAKWRQPLSRALRGLRLQRGLHLEDIAPLLGIDRRSYQNFEAGRGKLNVARVLAFSKATDTDPYAILLGTLLNAPDFAIQASGNKFMVQYAAQLKSFQLEVGDDLGLLDAASLEEAFSRMFAGLRAEVLRRRGSLGRMHQVAVDWRQPGDGEVRPETVDPSQRPARPGDES